MTDPITVGLLTKLGEKAAEIVLSRVSKYRHAYEDVLITIDRAEPCGSGVELWLTIHCSRELFFFKSITADGWWLSEINPDTRRALSLIHI